MAYRIVTDTGCDFPRNMYQEKDLAAVALSVNYKGKEYTDYTETWLKEIYTGLRAGEKATTSAVNPEGWSNTIKPILEAGEDVLVLAFSSGLSATYQSAVIAAQELMEEFPERKVNVVDTRCASLGQGLFVHYACCKRDSGMDLEQLTAWCEENKLHLCHWFTVDDLMYLKRGGRVSAATALVGTMLQIKPVLHVDDEGHLIKVTQVRGRKKAIRKMAEMLGETIWEGSPVFISNADCLDEAELLAGILEHEYHVDTTLITDIGSIIGAHAGPGTLALFFRGSHR